jgi:hypothetical protein
VWARDDLVRRLCDVLDVARNAIARLASEGFTDAQEPANTVRPEKVISESALLLLATSRVAHHPDVGRRLRDVAEGLIPHARGSRMVAGMCLEPALAWDYAFAHICLKRLGYPDRRVDAVLDMIARSRVQPTRERLPHRALEQLWVQRHARGIRPTARRIAIPAAPALVRSSGLCRPMDLLGAGREDIYAFTHCLMYVTDFNIQPWRLPRPRTAILGDAEAMLARCLDDQDYDLAGEVLMTWPLTGTSWDASAAFGFRVLAALEDQAGFLPSASTRPDRLALLQGDERARYLLATAYHTAYVMGLLCAVALQPDRAPPTGIKAPSARPGVGDQLVKRLDDGPRAHWRDEFDRLSGPERDGLARMLLTIGFRRSLLRRDVKELHALLRIGDAAGLTDMPAASHAAELLTRLVHIGTHPREPP